MDDSEYYRIMREQYSHSKFIHKKHMNSGKTTDWIALQLRQGREDAQLLDEKGFCKSDSYEIGDRLEE